MAAERGSLSTSSTSQASEYDPGKDGNMRKVEIESHRFPFCLVWVPIPILTWFFPFIGHMGIGTSSGVIMDFSGPYFVGEDDMAFGWPARYLVLDPWKAKGGLLGWDRSVAEASEIYRRRVHNLICDNCHSHVATALTLMHFDRSSCWNMFRLSVWMFFCGKYVGILGFVRTWVPFILLVTSVVCLLTVSAYS